MCGTRWLNLEDRSWSSFSSVRVSKPYIYLPKLMNGWMRNWSSKMTIGRWFMWEIKLVPHRKMKKVWTTLYRITLWKGVIMYSKEILSTCARREGANHGLKFPSDLELVYRRNLRTWMWNRTEQKLARLECPHFAIFCFLQPTFEFPKTTKTPKNWSNFSVYCYGVDR